MLAYGAPVKRIDMSGDYSFVHRGHWSPLLRRSVAMTVLGVICLAGPCGEETIYGPIRDDGGSIMRWPGIISRARLRQLRSSSHADHNLFKAIRKLREDRPLPM